MTDLVGHFGYLFLMAGQFLVSKNKTLGWTLRCSGDVVWIVLGTLLGMSSIIVWSAVFLGLDLNGWRLWRSRDTLEKVTPHD